MVSASPKGVKRAHKKSAQSPRKIILAGILQALESGPATAAEIDLRLGLYYGAKNPGKAGSHTSSLLRILERQGLVSVVGSNRNARLYTERGPIPLIWAKVISPEKAR